MTVGDLLARTSSHELTEWMAYERISGPLDGGREDHQLAVIAKTIADVNRGKRAPFKLDDFVIEWDRQPMTWQQMLANAQQWTSALGGSQ